MGADGSVTATYVAHPVSVLGWSVAELGTGDGTLMLKVAARLAKQPAGSLSTTKKLMRNATVLLAQIGAESERFAERLQTAEAREAFTAFAEKRAPDFAKVAG